MLDQGSANRASRARKQFAVLKRLWIRQSAQMATRCSRWAMLPKWILKPGLDSQIKRRHTRAKVHPVYLVVCLLIALVVLVTMARGLNVSYPIVLVFGGLVLALFPRLPEVRLEADIVFLVFLPPLLYWDALNSSWREIPENWGQSRSWRSGWSSPPRSL
jgi:hypothetical protein